MFDENVVYNLTNSQQTRKDCDIPGHRTVTMKLPALAVIAVAASHFTSHVAGQEWELLYQEDFTNPLPETDAQWVLEDYATPFDTIMEDNGM